MGSHPVKSSSQSYSERKEVHRSSVFRHDSDSSKEAFKWLTTICWVLWIQAKGGTPADHTLSHHRSTHVFRTLNACMIRVRYHSTTSEATNSACSSVLGLISKANGSGQLTSVGGKIASWGNGSPSGRFSEGGLIVKLERILATMRKLQFSAIWRPGHILGDMRWKSEIVYNKFKKLSISVWKKTYRRPKPKIYSDGDVAPLVSKKRSGLNLCGSGTACESALKVT